MKTEKLFYTEPETAEFSARVLSCREAETGWELVLDRTAFYPEGGGQPCDLGSIDGAGVRFVSGHGGEIVHIVDRAFVAGSTVRGAVDMRRRRDYTEQHTADHVLTGVIHRRYGFDNVGFHMGAETTAIDLNGVLTAEQLAEMEDEANAAIRADLPVLESYPTGEELKRLDYRSKKELEGEVRIITIPGVDVCACCGTHVARTGALGLIKILSAERLRGGIRLEFAAGERAWRFVSAVFEENRKNSVLLSAKQQETSAAVSRLLEEQARLKAELAAAEKRWYSAVSRANEGKTPVFEPGLSAGQVQRLANELMSATESVCAVFSGSDAEGWRYAVGQRDGDVRGLVKRMNEELSGRGGGRPAFAQGQVFAARKDIEKFFEKD